MIAYLLIVLALIISGCKDKAPQTTDSNTSDTKTTNITDTNQRRPLEDIVSIPESNEVAVTVNGIDITEGQINEIIAPQLEMFTNSIGSSSLPVDTLNQYTKQLREQILQQLILKRLLDPMIANANIVVAEQDAVDLIKSQLAEQPQEISMEDFKKTLKQYGIVYEEEVQRIKEDLKYQKYMDEHLASLVDVTEADANEFYQENIQGFEIPEQVRASHILVRVDPNDPNETKQQAREKIDDLLEQVREGKDFAELAKETGGFPTAPIGGDLDYFPRGIMDKPFEDAAFGLEIGQVSDVIQTVYGYHIIKVTDHKETDVTPFDEVKGDITDYLRSQKMSEAAGKFYESLIEKAEIKFPEGKELKTGLFGS